MATLSFFPPNPENQAAFGGIPGIRFTEGVVFAIEGPDPAGPEAAGSVLVLQSALDSDPKAQQFYQRAAKTVQAAQESEGFLRFLAFNDGICSYALGFWRTQEDALAFARSLAHTEAMNELEQTGNQYSHFAGLFNSARQHHRHVYCDRCQHANQMPAQECAACGNGLIDVFAVQHRAAAQPAH